MNRISLPLLAALAFVFGCSSNGNDEDGKGGIVRGEPVFYEGETYETVKIGSQTWMARNLNFAPQISDCDEFGNDCSIYDAEGSVCYDNDPANCLQYGRLYDWETANLACPSDWHLPSNAEWDRLYRYADGTRGTEDPYSSETAGRYLKATSGWSESGNGEDKYGFKALPGGFGDGSSYVFNNAGYGGDWWSSSEYEEDSYAYSRYMYYEYDGAYWDHHSKTDFRSVRCVKD